VSARSGGASCRLAAVIGLACFVAFWWTPHTLGITDLDEGLYAAVARDMALTGDWITPRVNGVPFYEKPPLVYWLSALCLRVFGTHEWAVRMPSAIAATLLVLATFVFGRRYWGRETAAYGAAFLALSPMTFAAARLATTDAVLTLCVACTMYATFTAMSMGETHPRRATWWAVAAWAAAGLGTLAKGAPGAALPLVTLGVFGLIEWRRRPLCWPPAIVKPRTLVGLAVFLAIVVPWHVAALRANGRPFVEEYIVRQHVGRFRGGDVAHRAPAWFFVPGFLVGFFPWSVLTVAGLVRRDREPDEPAPDDEPRRAAAFLRTWFAVVFVAFSAGGSKLISYILPLYPAAALLAARWVVSVSARPSARGGLVSVSLAGIGVAGALLAAAVWPDPVVGLVNRYADSPVGLSPDSRALLAAASQMVAAVCVGLAACGLLAAAGRPRRAPAGLVVGMAAFLAVLLLRGVPLAQDRMIGGLHGAVARAAEEAGKSGRLTVALRGPRRPSVLFYVPGRMLADRQVEEHDADVWTLPAPDGGAAPQAPWVAVVDADAAARIERRTANVGRACRVGRYAVVTSRRWTEP
jgi:4-amino-4-deoxy-L-arabinose transferase-like glycosyltransferase